MISPAQPAPAGSEPQRPVFIAKDWLFVAILTMVMVVIWIGASVYFALNTSTVPGPQQKRIQPFSTQLDEEVLQKLSERRAFVDRPLDEAQRVILIREGETVTQAEPSPTVTPIPTSTSVPSPTPTGTP